jgi:hypothetical protein
MKLSTNLLLASVLLALAGFVYFYEIKGGEERQKSEEAAKKLLTLEADSVTAFSLQPAGIAFKKEEGSWQIVQPINYPADETSVTNLLEGLQSAKRERDIAQEASTFASYGLAPAHREILISHAGKHETIYLGDKNTTSSYVYARVDGKPQVVLTEIALLNNSEKKLEDWRDKRLLKFETGQVQHLSLHTPRAYFDLQKESGKWKLVRPLQADADESKISQILNRLSYANVAKFVAETMDDRKSYGLEKPNYELRLTLGEDSMQKSMQFGKRTSAGYFAYDPARPQVFLVDSSLVQELEVELMDLREKRLAGFESYRADYLSLQYPDTTIICEKDTAAQWRITAPQEKKAKSWKVSNITNTLAGLQAATFVEEQAGDLDVYGLVNPRARITVKEKGAELAQVLLGNVKEDHVYAKAAGKATITLVKKEEADRLLVKLSELIE